MPLTLYRRHLKSCHVHQLHLPARAVRLYTDCECPIWMYGRTEKSRVPRQSTGHTNWAAADALRRSLIGNDRDEEVHGPKLADCIVRYIASREHELKGKTKGQHELVLSRLERYAATNGVFHIRGLSVDLLEDFKVGGLAGLADTSKATSISKVRCFLREAYRRGWITEPLVEKLRAHTAVYEQKEPFTEEEVQKVLNEALNLNGGTHAYAAHAKTFRLLLELMLETGMRVSDAVLYNPAATTRGKHLWIYSYVPVKSRLKAKPRAIEAYLCDRLKTAIDECEWLSSKLPFSYGSFKNGSYLANQVYERMKQIGKRCGVSDCRPHRLRDTFAVRYLLKGFALEDVQRLLGHSSIKVTEAHYAKWVPARTRRLERMLAESLVNT